MRHKRVGTLVRARLNSFDPFLSVEVCNVVADFYVSSWSVGEVERSITFENESLSNVDEVGHYVVFCGGA